MYSISQTAEACGLTVKAVRYYADIGLLKEATRSEAGYRLYDDDSIETLTFVRRARDFGFSIPQCRELLELFHAPDRTSSQVKSLAQSHLERLEKQRQELSQLCDSLKELVDACPGDSNAACPIIDRLT